MKLKPAQRNALRAAIDEAGREVLRLEASLEKFAVGTLPHRRIKDMLDAAQVKQREAWENMKANLTQS